MTKTIIYENQVGLLIQNGTIVRSLGAGTYRTYGFRNEIIVTYPRFTHSQNYTIPVRTLEAAFVTVNTTIGVTITNPKPLYASDKSTYEIVNQAVTRQAQEVVSTKTLTELLGADIALDVEKLNYEIGAFGLTGAIELSPKVQLPRNLQNAIDAQEVARQRAKADLEEARGRTAVIRHYANVAKATQDNPDLLKLLLGQKARSVTIAFDALAKAAK